METAGEVSEFLHDPLSDPRACIRLLRVLSIDLARDVPVHCELSTWPSIDRAPKYSAVSYPWGKTTPVLNILLNGRRMEVRSNCEYVLSHIGPHVKNSHIWIDAVCINQIDNDEKSEQVAKMSEIFKRAIQVLACVGEHKDDSELLYNIIQRDALYFRSWRTSFLEEEDIYFHSINYYSQLLFWKLKLKLRNAKLPRLRKALEAFLGRPYFHRVWIYQELFLGQTVSVICGHESIPISWIWTTCLILHAKLSWVRGRPRLYASTDYCIRPQMDLLQAGSTNQKSMPLEFALAKVKFLHCQDPRDRFYGILSMIDWDGREPIQPEYNKDRLDLAVEVLKHLDLKSSLGVLLQYASNIGKMLELNSEPPQRLTDSIRNRKLESLEKRDIEPHFSINNWVDTIGMMPCRITGLRLSCQNGRWWFQQNSEANVVIRIDKWKNESTTRTHQLTSDILLAPEARDGDWLLLYECYQRYAPYCFLARDNNDDSGRWELVGKGLVSEFKESSWEQTRLVSKLDPVFTIYLDAEDVLCLLFSFQWKLWSLLNRFLDEGIITEYFESRLCRKRYSSFAVRENINSSGTEPTDGDWFDFRILIWVHSLQDLADSHSSSE